MSINLPEFSSLCANNEKIYYYVSQNIYVRSRENVLLFLRKRFVNTLLKIIICWLFPNVNARNIPFIVKPFNLHIVNFSR